MEQSEVELNEKLAKWAGFKQSDKAGKSDWHYGGGGKRIPNWHTPDGYPTVSWVGHGSLPRFTDSLDLCFRWLVPKCGHVGLSTAGGNFDVTVWAKDADSEYEGIMVRETTPALALCKAIEKLIDSTK